MTETLKTGIPAVDRYLMNGYDEVRGFSSLFAATICGHLLRSAERVCDSRLGGGDRHLRGPILYCAGACSWRGRAHLGVRSVCLA
jgi:hypothetical protein